MFTSFASVFAGRSTSIKNQKLVSEVVKHSEKQNGLAQVRTRGLHDDWPEAALPWVQLKDGFGSGSKDGTTNPTQQLAPVGSKVYTQFEDESQYHGQMFSGPASDDKKNPEFTGDNYGKTYGHADPGGNLHRNGTEEGKEFIERTHVSGSGDKYDEKGNYTNKASGGHNFEAQKDMNFKTGGDMNFEGQTINLKGAKLILEGATMEIRGDAKSTKPILPGAPGPGTPSKPSAPTKRQRPTFNKPGSSF